MAQPERISADNLATHQAAQAQMQAAQTVWHWWLAQLGQRYKLNAQDRIAPDGTIQRATPQ